MAVGAVALLLTGCGAAIAGPLVSPLAGPLPPEQLAAALRQGTPDGNRLFRFRWLFRDETSSAGGRGSVRVAAPDSLRFDVVGPLGSGASAAVVVADAPVWVEPKDAIEKIVPSYPLMWAMIGVARPPAAGADVRGSSGESGTAWRVVADGDTTEYLREPTRLVVEVRRAGKVIGRATTTLGPEGQPVRARLVVPSRPAQLDVTFTALSSPASFEAGIWQPRAP
ncbi:MAG: hypothetical protein NW201_09940 [Gemmatimonadales bacterium]|nr:hypothetical protein [Gemmatimonadales bacterium]